MNNNEIVDRALAQARELQKTMANAVTQAGEHLHPVIEQSVANAKALQETLGEHAAQTTAVAQEQTHKALGHLSELIKLGGEAMKSSAETARATAMTMMEQTRKTIDDATAAMGKKPEDAAPAAPTAPKNQA